jgi:hypothetical protein
MYILRLTNCLDIIRYLTKVFLSIAQTEVWRYTTETRLSPAERLRQRGLILVRAAIMFDVK